MLRLLIFLGAGAGRHFSGQCKMKKTQIVIDLGQGLAKFRVYKYACEAVRASINSDIFFIYAITCGKFANLKALPGSLNMLYNLKYQGLHVYLNDISPMNAHRL